MKKLLIITLFSTLILSCRKEEPKRETTCDIVETFNIKASNTFKKKYLGSHDFDIMNKRDQCILESTIENYLNSSNNWSTSIIDSFYVRSYSFGDFIDRFSFVSNKHGEFYFVYAPEFNNRFSNYKKYYTENHLGMLRLNDSLNNYVVKFEMEMLKEFLSKEVTQSKSFADQVTQVQRLLPVLLPQFLSIETYTVDFADSLSHRPVNQANKIMETLEPVVPAKDLTLGMSSTTRKVYRNDFGFVIIHFKRSLEFPEQLDLDFYFIPDRYIGRYIRHGDPQFGECNQL